MKIVNIPAINFEIPDDMTVPEFAQFTRDALKELVIKFPCYGNSWEQCDLDFWNKRLENEVEEFKKALTPAAKVRKLVNIFNIAAMARTVILRDESLNNDLGRLFG